MLRSAMRHSTAGTPVSSPSLSTATLPLPSVTSSHPVSSTGSASPSVSSSPVPSPSSPLATPSSALYTPKVSFDTFENPAASMFSFTLSSASSAYVRTPATRVFLCAASPDESGEEALDWVLESLVQDSDELVVFRGVEEDVLSERDHDDVREEARQLMRRIQKKAVEADPDRRISLHLEYIPGKITDTLDRLIALYRPDSVVVGTRGRKPWQTLTTKGAMGSVSRYVLIHSPVPIIVVRPERKVKKAVEKRRADPKRGTHFD